MGKSRNESRIERCPECGAALTVEARENAAARVFEFIRKGNRENSLGVAASLFSCALELATEAGRPDLRAHAYGSRGACYEQMGEREIAMLDYEDAHTIDPDNDAWLQSLSSLRARINHEKRLAAKGAK